MRLFKPNVPHMQAQKNIDGLVKALTDRDVEIREGATRALGELSYPRVVMPLCSALRDTEWTVRLTAIEALSQINDPRSIEALASVLKDEKPAVHKAAMEVLVKFGTPAVNALTRALTDKIAIARLNAAVALGKIGDKNATPALINALGDAEAPVREAVAHALGLIGDQRAIDPLSTLLQDGNARVADAVAQALHKIGLPTDPASQARFAVARNDWNRAVALGASALDALVGALNNESSDVRRNAAKSLGLIGDARAVTALLKAMHDEEWFVREAAGWSLAHIKDSRIVNVLCMALKDQYAGAREAAAKALAELADPRTIAALIEALNDEEYYVGESAVVALANIGPVAAPPLIAAIKDSSSSVRVAISTALEKIGVPDDPVSQAWFAVVHGDWARAIELGDIAVEPLISALRDDDHRVRRAAAETLGQIGQIGAVRAVEPLCAALRDRKPDVRKSIADVLVKIGQPAVDPLIYALNDIEWSAREAAAWTLGQIKDPWSIGPLCDAMQDPRPEVMEAAADALHNIGLPEDPEANAWYAVAKKDWARASALGSLAVEPLCHALRNGNADIRWGAARALANIGDPRAADTLRTALRDDEAYVREAAADALARMALPGSNEETASAMGETSTELRPLGG